jgi:hypothetical protein
MILPLLLSVASAGSINGSANALTLQPSADRVQIGFYNFRGNRVRVLFNKRQIVNKITFAPERGDRSGISGFALVQISGCGILTVIAGKKSVSQEFCAGRSAKSIRIDAGPPLKITLLQTFQGID